MGGGTGTSTSTSTGGTGQQQLPSWLTGAFGGQATSPPPPPPPATPSTPGFTPAGQEPGQQGNLGFSAAGSQNWNPMSMMMWQLMNGGMQQPSGSGGLYGGVSGGMPDWMKMFMGGQGGGQAAPAEGTPPPGNYMTGARDTAGYQNNLFDPSQMLPKVVAPTPAAPAAAAPQQQQGYSWAPMQGPEPPTSLTAIQKKMVESGQIPTGSPETKNWLRWKLGEMGYTNRVSSGYVNNAEGRQDAWNKYGGPGANTGTYAGVAPPGYSAHQWYGAYQ